MAWVWPTKQCPGGLRVEPSDLKEPYPLCHLWPTRLEQGLCVSLDKNRFMQRPGLSAGQLRYRRELQAVSALTSSQLLRGLLPPLSSLESPLASSYKPIQTEHTFCPDTSL